MQTAVHGIRGAIDVTENSKDAILEALRSFCRPYKNANPALQAGEIASVFFTLTPDLNAIYPAVAARSLGWTQVPLLCAQEIPVPGGLPRCLRVLIHWNTPSSSGTSQSRLPG